MNNNTKYVLIGLTLAAGAAIYYIRFSKQGLASYLVRKGKFKSKEALLLLNRRRCQESDR